MEVMKQNICFKMITLSLLCVLLILPSIPNVHSKRIRNPRAPRPSSGIPIISENDREPKRSRQTQCVLRKSIYNIGDTWHPNMSVNDDEPEGINYCLICQCLPRMKKNRIVSKTHCLNISHKCPVPKCNETVLLPKRCCPTCPGDSDTNNIEETFMKPKQTLELINKKDRNYYAILTDKNDNTKKSFAYFQINRGHLLYIIESLSSARPKVVRFYDHDDSMLEEFMVNGTTTDRDTFKIFGNWSRIPNDYRRMVRKGNMKVSIAYNPTADNLDDDFESDPVDVDEGEVIGLIHKFGPRALSLVSDSHTHYYNILSSRKPKLDNYLHTLIQPPPALKSIANDEGSDWNNIDTKCYYEARIFEDGSQWSNQNDICEMCSCKRGRVECATEMCISLSCEEQIRIPGQCCPVCKYSESINDDFASSNATCSSMDRKYFVGSKWHPYMPPKGFDQCTTCTCVGPNQVKCERLQCPPLNCHDTDAFYANEYDCCKRCPSKVYDSHTVSIMDQLQDAPLDDPIAIMKAKNDQLLLEGGCQVRDTVRANGEEWNPVLGPLGVNVCIKCQCKNGQRSCVNMSSKCVMPVDCVPIRKQGECCLVCESESHTRDGRRGSGFFF